MVKYHIVIVHEKSGFFFCMVPWRFGLQKILMSKHRKNYILRDINYFVKMSVSTLPNFVEVGSEFESLEVIEITELANAFVRLVSTLIAKVLNV